MSRSSPIRPPRSAPSIRSAPAACRADRTGVGGGPRVAGRHRPAEGELPPARAGRPPPRHRGRRTPSGAACRERLLVATAASYVVSPGALGPVAADPGRDQRPAVGELSDRGGRARGPRGRRAWRRPARRTSGWRRCRSTPRSGSGLPPIGPPSPMNCPTRSPRWWPYHDESDPRGRTYRLVVAAYPKPKEDTKCLKKDDSGRRWVEMEFLCRHTRTGVARDRHRARDERMVHSDHRRRTCRWRNHIRLR